jgi:DNA-binding response OmpR family regulator
MLILAVEDEPLIAHALEWELKDSGHRILGPADSVEGAVVLCGELRPDLALIDLNLRDGGSGIDVARYLHERYGTPCLFITGQLAQARTYRGLAIGLLRKPYDSASLPQIVQAIIDMIEGKLPAVLPPALELFGPVGRQTDEQEP